MMIITVHGADADMTFGALLLMQGLDPKHKIVGDSEHKLYPHAEYTQDTDIFDVQEFHVRADNVDVVCCNSIVNAITACFITRWLFDIQYIK